MDFKSDFFDWMSWQVTDLRMQQLGQSSFLHNEIAETATLELCPKMKFTEFSKISSCARITHR